MRTSISGATTPRSTGWIDDGMAALRRDFLPADLRVEMDAAGIDACVAVQVRQTLEETRWLLSLADEHPVHRRRGGLGRSAGARRRGADSQRGDASEARRRPAHRAGGA